MKDKPYIKYCRANDKEEQRRIIADFERQRFYYENRELFDGLIRTMELLNRTSDMFSQGTVVCI